MCRVLLSCAVLLFVLAAMAAMVGATAAAAARPVAVRAAHQDVAVAAVTAALLAAAAPCQAGCGQTCACARTAGVLALLCNGPSELPTHIHANTST